MKKIKELFQTLIRYIKEERGLVLFFFVGLAVILIPTPYFVVAPGGITDISSRIDIENFDIEEEVFHSTFISEYEGRIPILIYAFFNKDFEIVSAKDMIIDGEDYEDELRRGKLYFNESFDNSVISSFSLTNFEYKVLQTKFYVLYTEEKMRDLFRVGDQIIKAEDKLIVKHEDIIEALKNKNIGDEIKTVVIRDKKEITITSILQEIDGEKRIGIVIARDSDIESTPKVTLSDKANEYGPSGGFMSALAMYYALEKKELNLKIAGTGTIEEDGTVGDIGGVDKKVIAASDEELDIFFVPMGSNYEEAMKVKKERKLEINIVGVKTLSDAIDYISKFDK